MKQPELAALASRLLAQLALTGVRGAIVALSSEECGHSYYTVRVLGPCIELEGLSSHIAPVLAQLWPKDQAELTRPPAPPASEGEEPKP